MSRRIKAISVANVRGVRKRVTLDLNGRGLLLRGDNGTGKSSIVQALSLALVGRVPSALEELPAEFVRHRKETDRAKSVVVELLPEGRIELRGDKVEADQQGQAFLDACRHAFVFLRRDELMRVVAQEPTKRLRYFEGFLELGHVDRLEEALGARKNDLKQRTKQLEHSLELQLAVANRALGASITSSRELLTHMIGRTRECGLQTTPESTWKELCGSIKAAAGRATMTDAQRGRLAAEAAEARGLQPPTAPKRLLAALRSTQAAAQEPDLLDLLTQARDAVEADAKRSTCPVCEQTVSRRSLSRRLTARLEAMSALQERLEEAEGLAVEWTDFLDALERLEQRAFDEGKPNKRPEGVELLEHLADQEGLSRSLLARLTRLRSVLDARLKETPGEAQAVKIDGLMKGVRQIGEDLSALLSAEAQLANDRARLQRLDAFVKALGDARKTVVERILSSLSEVVEDFYRRIHPPEAADEATGAPQTKLQRQGGGRLLVNGTFAGEDVGDPRHIYSDGHLDTVGLCFFLALRRSRANREGARDPKLMVLDDIVGSIDAGHFGRLLELVRDEFSDHQVMLVSHNSLLIKQARRILPNSAAYSIARWSLEGGPQLTERRLALDDLRRALDTAGEPDELARALLAELEPFLHQACAGFGVKLPYGREDLTVAEYWGPLRKQLSALAKGGAIPAVDVLLARIGEPDLFRNALGAHYNPPDLAGAQLRPVQQVVESMLSMIEQISCARCKSLRRLRNTRRPEEGVVCNCPRSSAPKLSCQSAPSSGVGES